jgi:tRNA modification GTPase
VLDRLLATLPQAVRAREGMQVVLAGVPNAGKSSLFNALLGDPRAIVSDVPGTTRDAIEALLDAEPWPWRLIDTAGLREATEPVERLGVEVSERRLAGADVVLVCADDDDRLAYALERIAALSPARRVAVRTKVDDARAAAAWTPSSALASALRADGVDGAVAVSAINGLGLEVLRARLTAVAQAVEPEPVESQPMILRARHAAALRSAREEVTAFLDAWESQALPAPVVATHLRAAVHALDELMGTIDMDDILGRVFRDFCVGK